MSECKYPLIIVFYLDKTLFAQKSIVRQFAESVDELLRSKQSDAMAFFMPTEGPERVECINPQQVSEPDMERINKIVGDIAKSFDIK